MKQATHEADAAKFAENVWGLCDEMVVRNDLHLLDVAPELVSALEIIRRHAYADRRRIR